MISNNLQSIYEFSIDASIPTSLSQPQVQLVAVYWHFKYRVPPANK